MILDATWRKDAVATSLAFPVSEDRIRLVLEAECSRCGPIFQAQSEGVARIQAAITHTSATGHVVILNGTVDVPDAAADQEQ